MITPRLTTAVSVYVVAAVGLCIIYKVADGQPSSLVTVAAELQLIALCFKAIRVLLGEASSRVLGISTRALVLEMMGLSCRLASTVWFNGYLPVDPSGDYMYLPLPAR